MRPPSYNSLLCFTFGNLKYLKIRRFCCIILLVVSVLAIHQLLYLGGVHYVLLESGHASIQHVPTTLMSSNVTWQRAVLDSNNNIFYRTSISASDMRISLQSQQSSHVPSRRYSRVVFLHQEDQRDLEKTRTNDEPTEDPLEVSRLEPWNSYDQASEQPPMSVEFVPINVATGQIREGSSSKDCQTTVASWQTSSFPNCNAFHELDFVEDVHKFLSNGEYRDVWKIHNYFIPLHFTGYEEKETLVLKTLR